MPSFRYNLLDLDEIMPSKTLGGVALEMPGGQLVSWSIQRAAQPTIIPTASSLTDQCNVRQPAYFYMVAYLGEYSDFLTLLRPRRCQGGPPLGCPLSSRDRWLAVTVCSVHE